MTLSSLQPGDCLLYRPQNFFGWLVAFKTWHAVAHVEVYIGDGTSVASRDGLGVNRYPLRTTGLAQVRRPAAGFSLIRALTWFSTHALGQAYDWLGLARFLAWGRVSSREDAPRAQFCSEFATRFYAAGGFRPFGDEDADAIAPCQFQMSALLTLVWPPRPPEQEV